MSSIALAIGGFIAGKDNVRYTSPNIYYRNTTSSCLQISAAGQGFTTNSGSGILFKTTGGGSVTTFYENKYCTELARPGMQLALKH